VPPERPERPAPSHLTRLERDRLWRCDFCGVPQSQAEWLLLGRGAVICAECVELCYEYLQEMRAKKEAAKKGKGPLHPV
jgi:hypothetical protein